MDEASDDDRVTIYHNQSCGTSRSALALIRASGVEPEVIHYLEQPPSRPVLQDLLARAGLGPRDVLRRKGSLHAELGLDDPGISDDALLDAMMAHPILIERPIVVGPRGVCLARPAERVLAVLGRRLSQDFTMEDGTIVPAEAG